MAMGREGDRQGDPIVTWWEMPHSPGHGAARPEGRTVAATEAGG
jgi:hypothetical protein